MPALEHVRDLAREGKWTVKFASAFPVGPSTERYGIRDTSYIEISREDYESCLDPWDYELSTKRIVANMKRPKGR